MASRRREADSELALEDGARIAVLGAGPAGSFSCYFLLEICDRIGLEVEVDIFDRKSFANAGPAGCNHCGGIVSESLVQMLATEGIVLPERVVQRGIDAYVLHSVGESVRIETPVVERRVAAVYRGAGPRGAHGRGGESFDAYLLSLAQSKGANFVNQRVRRVERRDGKPVVITDDEAFGPYDLLVGAVGVNYKSQEMFRELGVDSEAPATTRAFITEIVLGEELIAECLGDAMHVFLQHDRDLKFAAIIPKGEYATVCLIGDDLSKEAIAGFLDSREVRELFPPDLDLSGKACQCRPLLNVGFEGEPFADRVALVGDCGVSRLYKDGIGAAYRTAKVLAVTAVFRGVSRDAFRRHYWPTCRKMMRDNRLGARIFGLVGFIGRFATMLRGLLRVVAAEQRRPGNKRAMSMVMWDTFTGSAPYKSVFLRMLNPVVHLRLLVAAVRARFTRKEKYEDSRSRTNLSRRRSDRAEGRQG